MLAVEILDFYHASEHLWNLAHAVWDTESASASWVAQSFDQLRHRGPTDLAMAWATLPTLMTTLQTVVIREQQYIRYHETRIEARVKRCSTSGKVPAVCDGINAKRLRTLQRSGQWGAFWHAQSIWQRVSDKRRIAA
ncbi:MAG: hypothetical protein M1596_06735 [Firmicutes bacterium]|jgi:hypothetical protein|nr:hypothetical protein [Bacillota bacterium]MCL5971824.1 hypothetical protein [Bacillota bacterium]